MSQGRPVAGIAAVLVVVLSAGLCSFSTILQQTGTPVGTFAAPVRLTKNASLVFWVGQKKEDSCIFNNLRINLVPKCWFSCRHLITQLKKHLRTSGLSSLMLS